MGYAYQDIGGYRLHLRTYEGTIPGPTLHLSPGDALRIDLVNDLPPNRDAAPVSGNLPHHLNTTNFHLHGSHVSPDGLRDNVLRSVEPGGIYPVEIDLTSDHTRGTYWYHPHHHGSSEIQISSGMAGVVVIEGDFADVPKIASATERVLVLNEVLFDYLGTIEQYDTVWPEAVPRFLAVNGQREPILRLRPGEVQRWRIVHAGHEDNLRLALGGHMLHSIAFDGIQAAQLGRDESLLVAPGASVEHLEHHGSGLGRPLVDTIKGSRHPNMKELRPVAGDLRVLFAFDPRRMAILLIGGDKSGRWQEWYEETVPIADDLYDEHLRILREEGAIP